MSSKIHVDGIFSLVEATTHCYLGTTIMKMIGVYIPRSTMASAPPCHGQSCRESVKTKHPQLYKILQGGTISHHARFRSTMISGGGRMWPQEDSLNAPVDIVGTLRMVTWFMVTSST
ncbi:hypothetical protein Droror1_Dr00012327, partial [Drosera rotundifolia]